MRRSVPSIQVGIDNSEFETSEFYFYSDPSAYKFYSIVVFFPFFSFENMKVIYWRKGFEIENWFLIFVRETEIKHAFSLQEYKGLPESELQTLLIKGGPSPHQENPQQTKCIWGCPEPGQW